MRLVRYTVAGVLLFGSVLALTALLADPGFRWVGVVAAAIFVPLWYAITAVNAYLGVTSAGYPVRDEALVFVPTFGVPAVVAGVIGWVSRQYWDGGPVVHGGRWLVVLLAGLALWAAIVVLVGLLAGLPTVGAGLGPAFMFFTPLWVLLCVADLVVGSEFLVSLPNVVVPVGVAVAAWRLTARRAIRVQRVPVGDAGRLG
jgi:hypothetical protein